MPDWPADKVERWPLARLVPYARNARTHSDAQVDQIAASIREWGWTNPVLVDGEGGIIAGHGRILAAKKLGLDDAPVMVARGWSEAQKRAYILADNKLALNAGWDDALLRVRSQIVWTKPRHVISRGHYHWQHEPCWYAVRKGGTGHWTGDRAQTTVWPIAHPKSETGHGTQKPVECMKRPIENNSSPGQAVYEPFSGSGTTIIAAEMTGRACHAIELNPAYVDVAVKRWQAFTGEFAIREADGRAFDEIAAERRPQAA